MSYKGKKIHARDRNLVEKFCTSTILCLFFSVIMLLNIRQLLNVEWNKINLLSIATIKFHLTNYHCFSFFIGVLVCCIGAYVFYNDIRCYDYLQSLIHRQKLARMILENKWCEIEQNSTSSYFKDISFKSEKITYFPKIYYRMSNGVIYVQAEVTLGKYQEQLLSLEKKLESGFYSDLISKELKNGYIEYSLQYDTISNRITINDVISEDGRLKLMKNVYWDFDELPHMLIAGGTGGGKTYFLLTIIMALLNSNAHISILDPKNSDLADLKNIVNNVYSDKEEIILCVNNFFDEMMRRNAEMKLLPNYKTGKNYSYLGLSPHFLIFDEYVAFMDMLGVKENVAVINKIKQIVMLGRQSGFFLILACQRPDAKYLIDGIRDQFNFRIALGRNSDLGYNMIFGETDKKFFLKKVKGRGYVDSGIGGIREFYTPFVPKSFDFLEELEKIIVNKGENKKTKIDRDS